MQKETKNSLIVSDLLPEFSLISCRLCSVALLECSPSLPPPLVCGSLPIICRTGSSAKIAVLIKALRRQTATFHKGAGGLTYLSRPRIDQEKLKHKDGHAFIGCLPDMTKIMHLCPSIACKLLGCATLIYAGSGGLLKYAKRPMDV